MARQILKRLADSGVKSIDGNTGIANELFSEIFAKSVVRKNTGIEHVLKTNGANARGSSGTYHTTFCAAGDFYGVQPIVLVVTAPDDPTYTSDDIYNAIAVSPSQTVLTSGFPDPTGGSWTVASNVTATRQAGASTSNPYPRLLPFMSCASVDRTDGGPGKLCMVRGYSQGSSHANAATTRMPTYHGIETGANSGKDNSELWNGANGFSLAAQRQYWYRSGDYVSVNQSTFGAAATRWGNALFVGAKFYYCNPCTTVMGIGDSIMGGDYVEAGHPIRASYLWRAGYDLQLLGHGIEIINAGISGYRWDQFGPFGLALAAIHKPDVVLLPSWTPNGVATGVGTGNTAADANLHLAQALYYRAALLDAGIKEVILVTPTPKASYGTVIGAIAAAVRGSGLPYFDLLDIVSTASDAWVSGYSIDGQHLAAAGNVAAASVLQSQLQPYV